jgi:hypothetical protein
MVVAGAVWFALAALAAAAVTDVKAQFREGQTFITWKETGAAEARYRVWRHTAPITAENFGQAKLLAEVPAGSSRFREMWTSKGQILAAPKDRPNPAVEKRIIPRLAIQPVQQPGEAPKMLDEGTGLLVWTIKDAAPVESHYAVTTVAGGQEDKTLGPGSTAGPLQEKKEPIGAVCYYIETAKNKAGQEVPHREWYIMWMDYELWNPRWVGYAFPFALTLDSFKQGGQCPSAHLDGIGTMNVFSAGYTNYGCADVAAQAPPTWYFGYGETMADGEKGETYQGNIRPYIQYRILQTVLWARRKYNITDPRFIINGNSMGASGAIGFALQYPKFVTCIFANEGLTKYDYVLRKPGDKEPMWAGSIWGNYGKPELKNPVKFLPFGDDRLDWALKHDGKNVYDIRDAARFLTDNVDTSMPLLIIGHCFQDGSIPFYSQGEHFEKAIRDCRQCFVYTVSNGGHGWGQVMAGSPMKELVRWDESRPGFSNVPAIAGWQGDKKRPESRCYMYKVAWGVKDKPLAGKAIEETEASWSLPIQYMAKPEQEEEFVCDVTPRNLQKLKVVQGDQFAYEVKSLDGSKVEAQGQITADEHGLLLVPRVPIRRAGVLVVVTKK